MSLRAWYIKWKRSRTLNCLSFRPSILKPIRTGWLRATRRASIHKASEHLAATGARNRVSSETKGVVLHECDHTPPSARMIARNALWNLAGYATPLIAAIVAIPILIRSLGTARYGVLTIAWGLVGYFGFFDIGLDNALTKLIAERLGKGSEAIRDLIYTGFVIMAMTGVAGGIILAACSHSLAYNWFKVPYPLAHHTPLVFCIFFLPL